jgi:hypothetical protein
MAKRVTRVETPKAPGWRGWPLVRVVARGTIRGRILLAFLAMSVITGALGGYAAVGVKHAAARA